MVSTLLFFLPLLLTCFGQTMESEGLGISGLCMQMSPCGADCYTTCDNQCQCDLTADGEIPFPIYGGQCQETGFCEAEFLHMEDCVEEGGPSCPTMLGTEEVVEQFSSFDVRIDVRTVPEWDEGHANMSIHTPGLAANPAVNYMDKIGGLEDKNILVYCRSGGRAFAASLNLLKWGFKNIHSFYHGGFPDINQAIREDSESKIDHPTRSYCYITGPTDICPNPLPITDISSADDIYSLGDNVVLVDVRSKAKGTIPNTEALKTDKKRKVRQFVKKLDKDRDVIVTFCEGGYEAFEGAKKIMEHWKGPIYFVDNGGFKDLKNMNGFEDN